VVVTRDYDRLGCPLMLPRPLGHVPCSFLYIFLLSFFLKLKTGCRIVENLTLRAALGGLMGCRTEDINESRSGVVIEEVEKSKV
jgi:hypothetical protein